MASSNKKYLGQKGTEALAHGVDIITPRTWVLPAPASEADTVITDDGLDYMSYVYPTPESFKESIPQIKIGDRLDIGQFIGGSIPAIVPIVADLGGGNEITVPWSVGGSKGWVAISEEQIGFVFEYGGDDWGYSLNGDKDYPVWGDGGESPNGSGTLRPNWTVHEDLDCFNFKDKINIALKSTEGVHDVNDFHKNWMFGRLLSKSTIEGSDETYGVVVGVAKIATPGSDTETKIVPGIFMLSHKSSWGAQTLVTFYPLINMWQELYAMKQTIDSAPTAEMTAEDIAPLLPQDESQIATLELDADDDVTVADESTTCEALEHFRSRYREMRGRSIFKPKEVYNPNDYINYEHE